LRVYRLKLYFFLSLGDICMKKMFFHLSLTLGISATLVLGAQAQEPAKPAEPKKSVVVKPADAEEGTISPSDMNKPKPKPAAETKEAAPTTPVTEPAPQPAPTVASEVPCPSCTCTATPMAEAAATTTTATSGCCKTHSRCRKLRRSR
jgi:hypothetical protein